MTIEEFNNTRFGSGMKVIYKGVYYSIMSVNFEEALIGLMYKNDNEIYWVRYENCELITN